MSAPSEPTQSAEPIMSSLPATPGHVPTPLTGRQFTISAGDYQASFTELGGGLRELFYRGRPLVTGYQPDELPPAGAGQLLGTVAEQDRWRPVRVRRHQLPARAE